jgi:hypothetical protein
MSIISLRGDPLMTSAQALAFDTNVLGRAEVAPLHTALLDRFPAAFATFGKEARAQRVKAGQVWIWRESRPWLCFLIARDSPVGATRARNVDSAALLLARDYRLLGLTSLAVVPLGTAAEWPALREVLTRRLGASALPVTIYER